MKRKSGLHKKVSSIFGDVPLPENNSEKNPPQDRLRVPGIEPPSQASQAILRQAGPLSEEEEYAAEQRKKLFMVIGLVVVLAVVLFANFYKPAKKEPVAEQNDPLSSAAIAGSSAIDWPKLEEWPKGMRDPMVYDKNKARLTFVESKIDGPLVLRGIVHKPEGRSMALIGTEILYVGDEIDGWTLKEVQQELVKFENAEGEKLELKMKDR